MPLSGMRVLVVEDEPMIRFMLLDMIEMMNGTVVQEAATLDEACTVAAATDADLAILDINLRGEMSYPAAGELKSRGVPLFFVSGYAQSDLPPELAGTIVVPKPYTMSRIAEAADRVLSNSSMRAQA